MKLRAIHLLNRMERIERDLSEISTLRSTLQDDREYTSRLRTSLQDETVRMRELQTKILTQVIHNPPESLARIAAANSAAPRQAAVSPAPAVRSEDPELLRPPEIIVPGSRGASASKTRGETKGDEKGETRNDPKAQAGDASRPAREAKSPSASGARSGKSKRGGTGNKSEGGDPPPEKESFNFTFVQK